MRFGHLARVALLAGVVLGVGLRAATADGWDRFKQVARAAYFSEECRHAAATLAIPPETAAAALVALFQRRMADGHALPDAARREQPCASPPVLLINLLRSRGVDAVLTLVAAEAGSAAKVIDRLVVYVPVLDRHLDPTVIADGEALDRTVRARPRRMYFHGPSLPGSRDRCADLCLRVVAGQSG
jgi:hypothetical protein